MQTPLESVPDVSQAAVELALANQSAGADLTSMSESSNAVDTIPFELVDRTELVRLQQSNSDVSSLFELSNKCDKRYFVNYDVLLRTWRDKLAPPQSSIHQILVSTSLRPRLV